MEINSIDIFCEVIDNYGDVGVAYRLAREFKRIYPSKKLRLCLEGAQRLSGAADAVSQQRSYRQQRAVHPVPRPAVAQRGQWLSAVEITLLIYGRLSRALQ